jgi:hypothetical protein
MSAIPIAASRTVLLPDAVVEELRSGRSRHKAGRRCWADPPESAATAESTEPAWVADKAGPGGSLAGPGDFGITG